MKKEKTDTRSFSQKTSPPSPSYFGGKKEEGDEIFEQARTRSGKALLLRRKKKIGPTAYLQQLAAWEKGDGKTFFVINEKKNLHPTTRGHPSAQDVAFEKKRPAVQIDGTVPP